ncbi:MAG: hypothetical protein Q4C68_01895 [Moraxella sp.]|nr:hypothetical protein [Moraxella sp.]
MSAYSWLGLTKSDVLILLQGAPMTEFAHWLYIPHWALLLSFDKQVCTDVQLVA